MTVGMIGDGAWATAVAIVLARNGHSVKMWSPDPLHAQHLAATRYNNRYLPGVELPSLIEPTAIFAEAATEVDVIFEAIPVKYLRSVIEEHQSDLDKSIPWVILSKGVEPATLLLPTQLINSVVKKEVAQAVLMGPSFAKDIVARDITGMIVASKRDVLAEQIASLFKNSYVKIYHSQDILGVQWCGALKNVIALAIGIAEGAGYSDNTKAFLLTRGLHEMACLIRMRGGSAEIVYDLAGVGDLVLTSFGKSGRNMEVGRRLGQGQSQEEIIKETGYTPESFTAVHALPALLKPHEKSFPLLYGLWQVVVNYYSVSEWLEEIF